MPSVDDLDRDRVDHPSDADDDLDRHVHDALAHLYDPVYLQTHPLTTISAVEPEFAAVSAGRALQDRLTRAIATLKPIKETAVNAEAWRRHRILELRYLEGLTISEVQKRLAIGRSEYFREHRRAVDAVISLVRESLRPEQERVATSSVRQDVVVHEFPAWLTSFVGREQEKASILALVKTKRLLTLTGAGGCGKTRLAVECAHDACAKFPGGSWFVDLAQIDEQSQVAHSVGRVLGIHSESDRGMESLIASWVAFRRVLLVIDNCEHVIESCARLIETLLREAPNLHVLATSRERLGVAGEAVWNVSPLPVPETSAEVDDLVGNAAVKLLVDRARSVDQNFELTKSNVQAVADLCRKLDGLPLSLELAGARLSAFTPEQLLALINQRMTLLSGGRRTINRRQKSLKATIDWSYELLTEDEQRVFNRLAVFSGGWMLRDAEVVCRGNETDSIDVPVILASLVDKSLVVAGRQIQGERRYRMLDTLARYAWDKLTESGELDVMIEHHGRLFLKKLEEIDWLALSWTQTDRPRWIDDDHGNLRVALRRFIQFGQIEQALELGAALGSIWLRSGHLIEARELLEELNMAAKCGDPSSARAWSMFALASLVGRRGDYERTEALYELCLADFRAVGSRFGESWVLVQRATFSFMQGDFTSALDFLAASESIIDPEPGDTSIGLSALRYTQRLARGFIALYMDDYELAQLELEPLLQEHEAIGSPASPYLLGFLGQAAQGQGRLSVAGQYYREALTNGYATGDVANMAYTIERLAGLAAARGNYDRAGRLVGVASSMRKAVSAAPGIPQAAWLERELAPARLSTGEHRFAALVASGEELSFEEGVSEALAPEM